MEIIRNMNDRKELTKNKIIVIINDRIPEYK